MAADNALSRWSKFSQQYREVFPRLSHNRLCAMTPNMQALHRNSGDDEINDIKSGKETPLSTFPGLDENGPVAPWGERTSNVDLPGVLRLKQSENELSDSSTPIAIVGMAMRLPGGVRTGDQFWDCLMKREDGLCEVPKSRYNADSFYHPTRERSTRTKYGYFLQEDPACFDAQFFSVRKHEATRMDPQQRLLLELVWECLESAGETDWEGKDIGCFVGVFGEDWLGLAHRDPQTVDRYHALGTGDYILANCVSYRYDFRGPRYVIKSDPSYLVLTSNLWLCIQHGHQSCLFILPDCTS